MIESAAIILPDINSLFTLRKNVFATLIITLICTLLAWYAQYHWKRRKMYKLAAQRKGPLTLPFIGNALYFIGSTSDILNNVFRLMNEFESPVPVWLGQRLFFGIWEVNDLETTMNSPHALEKEELYKFTEVVVGTGLFTAPVDKWKRHRKIIMPTFNQKILDGFVEVFSEQAHVLAELLKKEAGKGSFDIFHYVSRCTLDTICETAMGIKVNAQTTESDYIKWSNKAMELAFKRMFSIFYHYDFIFNRTNMAKKLCDVVKKMHDFTGSVVTEKRKAYQMKLKENRERPEALIEEEPRRRKTFLQQLIELSEEGANFTDEELREEVNTFMIAGSDTTASVNSFTFIMLGMFPDVQDKVFEEVMDVVGPDRSMVPTDLGKLQYLERVIKETLRIFPVGPLLVRAITGDIKLGKYSRSGVMERIHIHNFYNIRFLQEKCTIPAGSSVVLSIIGLHRDAQVWPDPLQFDPDRFLPEELGKRHPYSWIPFSGGPRNCVGPKYAMMAMKVLIAMVIRKYRFFTDYENIEHLKLKADLVLKPVDGYKVYVDLRE